MANVVKSTKYHADRQMDLELLQSVEAPSTDEVQLSVSSVSLEPKAVSGMQKLTQRYARLLLTEYGSQKFQPKLGGSVLSSLGSGIVTNTPFLMHIIASASAMAVLAMQIDDASDEFGTPKPDEMISSATILGVGIDRASNTANARIRLRNMEGENYVYTVPVAIGVM